MNNKLNRLVSGITATGRLTLGNYLGAIKHFVALQDKYDSYFFVADLHALTGSIEAKDLKKNRIDIFALYLACGIDPNKSTIFFQSDVTEHCYLQWILTNNTTMGELSRMTQFKDKSSKVKSSNGSEMIPTGLFMYPVLMAGDIMLYEADLVPVGIDQMQHIELTRDLVNRLNNKYNTKIKLPEAYIPPVGAKIMSLTDPEKKMSKSDSNPKSSIYLLDDPQQAYNKIMKAKTDSENKVYISDKKPGVTSLVTIYASIKNISLDEAASHFKDADYAQLKIAVATEVKELLTQIQSNYNKMLPLVKAISIEGAKKASVIAGRTMNKIAKKVGLGE